MELIHSVPKAPIKAWDCSCSPKASNIPASQDCCPHCGAPMPQKVRTQIYRQVLRDFRRDRRYRIKRFLARSASVIAIIFRKIWPYLLILLGLFVVVSGVGWVIQQIPAILEAIGGFFRDIFETVGNFFRDVFDGPLEFVRDLLPEKAEEAVPSVPKEKDPFTFQKLIHGIKSVFAWIEEALVWIWDALLFVFELLKKLWKALVWVLKLLAGLAFVAIALVIELVKFLFKVIKFLISLV